MFRNRFDRTIEEVSIVYDKNWDDATKVKLFAQFLEEDVGEAFPFWEKFLERAATEDDEEGA